MDDDIAVVERSPQSSVVATRTEQTVVRSEASLFLFVEQQAQSVVAEQEATHVVAVGQQGPPGVAGPAGSAVIEFPFAFGDATPATVATAGAGKTVYGVQLHITTAFDGVGAALVVGDGGQPDRLQAAQENDPAVAGSYTSAPVHRYGVETSLLLGITAGAGATQGAGILVVHIQQ